MTLLLVALGAAVGAPLRYLTDRFVQSRHDTVFPWGTLAVNVTGSAVLGFLLGLPAGHTLMAVAGTGFCGALTTYSTFGYETLALARDGARLLALANVATGIVAGLAACLAGLSLAQALSA
ncbi:CrcB family protein [Sphaerisporangium sp. TRM90804]|uniref:fluoride efflux transporter FluC n=1 Tax=Sphaerisporangium sp. TRM90804 TaxID=3031113 RepID=UPI0024493108|nr:CrcB family protein [Sphaerisporangium sp. TRM90804]MDH2425985.1 CrcB family protein [Sphaerisporangium sp. TRM90804]